MQTEKEMSGSEDAVERLWFGVPCLKELEGLLVDGLPMALRFPDASLRLPLSPAVENLWMSRLPDRTHRNPQFMLLHRLIEEQRQRSILTHSSDNNVIPGWTRPFADGTRFRMYTLPSGDTWILHSPELFALLFEVPDCAWMRPYHVFVVFLALGWLDFDAEAHQLIAHYFASHLPAPEPDAMTPQVAHYLNRWGPHDCPEWRQWLKTDEMLEACRQDERLDEFVFFINHALDIIRQGLPLALWEIHDEQRSREALPLSRTTTE